MKRSDVFFIACSQFYANLSARLIYLILLLSFIMPSLMAFSQTCSQEDLAKIPGVWKQGLQGSTTGVSAADLAREKEVVAKAFNIIKENFQPMGCVVSWAGVYGFNPATGKDWVANPYGLGAYFLRYLCDTQKPGQHYVDVSTPTNLYINFNAFEWVKAANLTDDHHDGFLTFRQLPALKNGYYFFKKDVDYNSKIKKYIWLFTYNNKLPYRHFTKKEFLLNRTAFFNERIKEINHNDSISRSWDLNPEDRDSYIVSFNQQREFYNEPRRKIRELLNSMNEAEFSEPAIIRSRGDGFPLPDFVQMGVEYSDILMLPDLTYYNKNLPASAPQMFSIVLTISHDDPVFEHVYISISKIIEENIDKFRALLADQSQVTYPSASE